MFVGNNLIKRSIAERDEFSFLSEFDFDQVVQTGFFGFSGDSNSIFFSFKDGRVYDPENNYVYNYNDRNKLIISGSINTGSYNYWINNNYIAQYEKNSYAYKWFAAQSSSPFDLDCLIRASGQSVSFSFPAEFNTGQSFNFSISNLTPSYAFRVLSGDLTTDGVPSMLFGFEGGQFPLTVSTSNSILLKDFGAVRGVGYEITANLYTDQGLISQDFNIVDSINDYNVFWDLNNLNNSGNANFSSDTNNANDLVSRSYNYNSFGNFALSYILDNRNYSKSLDIKLIDSGGNSGTFYAPYVTGVSLHGSGLGYSGVPSAFFDNGASGIVSLENGYVSNISISYPGTGYSNSFYLSGGSPIQEASGVAILSGYERNFFEAWKLYTGFDAGSMSLVETGLFNQRKCYKYDGSLNFQENDLLITVLSKSYYNSNMGSNNYNTNELQYATLVASGLDNMSQILISGGVF